MAGKREVGFQSEDSERTITLRNVRSQGHTYIELREEASNLFIFFCNLCLAPCFSDSGLYVHLQGKNHCERLAMAKLTLLKSNPWPFSDGVLFFDCSLEQEIQKPLSSSISNPDVDVVTVSENLRAANIGKNKNVNLGKFDLIIPTVMFNDEISDLEAKFMGIGLIGARFLENDDKGSNPIKRIWCEWMGKKGFDDHGDSLMVQEHEFCVVAFDYNEYLGRGAFVDYLDDLLSEKSDEETEGIEGARKKRKKLVFYSDSYYDDSSEEGSQSPNTCDPNETRVRERVCKICQRKMLPGKDVATLVDATTQSLACSIREVNGVFHVFHISCLIHWILFCESKICTKNSSSQEVKQSSEKKQISSVFCPDCPGDDLENPNIRISEMCEYGLKVSDARVSWTKNPEELQNCSTGLHFSSQSEETVHVIRFLISIFSST